MTPALALAELHAAGVRVRLQDDGKMRLDASAPPPLVMLALARAHRDGIAELLRTERVAEPTARPLPGVPAAWCEGVACLHGIPPPGGITPARWAALAATSTYLLQSHGAELHRAGWDALDLFGLHRRAPGTNPAGRGLAWLLGAAGEVLDVAVDAVGMRCGPDGARMTFRRSGRAARAGVAPAWALDGESASHSAAERDGTHERTPTS